MTFRKDEARFAANLITLFDEMPIVCYKCCGKNDINNRISFVNPLKANMVKLFPTKIS